MEQGIPIVVSGIRATGRLHLGNYFGALRNFSPLQEGNKCYFFVADYHTLTTAPDPDILRQYRLPIVKFFLATGIDPSKSTIFYQSGLPEVAELTLLLGMVVSVAELNRCTTFKEMVAKNPDNVNHGLFTYPVLMAADIIIHKATLVPVGHDQLQHLEMTRSFARRFNRQYTDIFPVPTALEQEAIRIPGLDGNKMGKSDDNAIDLLDTPQTVEEKIKTALTDKERARRNDPGNPDERCASIFPLLQLIADDEHIIQVRQDCRSGQLACVDCKQKTAMLINELLEPIQAAYANTSDQDALDVLNQGTQEAKKSAQQTLSEVRQAMGLE
ncbi:tryptophan--tRNA ligase [Patescibacteria group bacterium]